MALSFADQAFLQKMMAVKAMSMAEVLKHYNKIANSIAESKHGERAKPLRDPSALDTKFAGISKAIAPHGFQLRSVHSKWEQKIFWGFINTVEDETVSVSNLFSKLETEMFFDIIDDILEADGNSITPSRAHDLGHAKGIKIMDAGAALQKMDRLRWFKILRASPHDDAKVVFGARSLLEIPRVRKHVMTTLNSRVNQSLQGGPSQTLKRSESDCDDDEEEMVINRSSRRRSSLPRGSQGPGSMDVVNDNDDNDEVDGDEDDEIRPSQSQSRQSRSSRLTRRSSRHAYD